MGFENGLVARASLEAVHASGRININTLHYDLDYGIIPADPPAGLQALADRLWDDLHGPYGALYDSGWQVQPIVVVMEKDPQSPNAARSEVLSGAAFAGTNAGAAGSDALPPACCAVATLKTNHIGRRATGRMFLGGSLFESHQNGGTWDATQLALWQAFLDAVPHSPDIALGPINPSVDWSVYSRTQRSQDVDPYLSHITAPILRSKVHWLRSRET